MAIVVIGDKQCKRIVIYWNDMTVLMILQEIAGLSEVNYKQKHRVGRISHLAYASRTSHFASRIRRSGAWEV